MEGKRIRPIGGRHLVAAGLAAGLLAAFFPGPAEAQLDPRQIAEIRADAPSCEGNPDARWRGRLAGNYEYQSDFSGPISFVGCFRTEAACMDWLQRSSGRIFEMIQFECRRR